MHILKISTLFLFVLLFHSIDSLAQYSKDKELADQYFENKEYEKASVLYEKIFDKNPTEQNFQPLLNCLLVLQNFDKAEKITKKQIKKNPDVILYQVELGYVFKVANQSGKSSDQYDKVIKQLAADQTRIVVAANAFIARHETGYAIETYLKGKKLLKGYYTFGFELADLYYAKRDITRMVEEYLDLINESPQYLQSVQNLLQNRLYIDPEGKNNESFRQLLLRRIQKQPEQLAYTELLLWFLVQQKDFDAALIQAKALDKRLREDGGRIMNLAELSVNNENYDAAINAYQYLISKGTESVYYLTARMEVLNTINKKLTSSGSVSRNELMDLEKDYKATITELGKNPNTAPLLRGLAHLQAFYLDKSVEARALLEETLKFGNLRPQYIAELKLELGDILLLQNDIWEATLIYSQVDKAFKEDPLGQEAKLRNAKLSFYRGEFDWAQAQLDVLKSATSQLIANDAMALSLLISDNLALDTITEPLEMYARADLLSYQNKDTLALQLLDSILIKFPFHTLTDEVLFRKSEVFRKKGDIQETVKMLQKIIDTYPNDILADDAVYEMAIINENILKNHVVAMDLYQQILIKYPGSTYVVDARKRFRNLRGDKIN